MNPHINRNNLHSKILIILGIVAFSEILYNGFTGETSKITENTITKYVIGMYQALDRGEYDRIAKNVIEGAWEMNLESPESTDSIRLTGTVSEDVIRDTLEEDLGVRGWRIRFVTLKVTGYTVVPLEELGRVLPREKEILDYINKEYKIENVNLVELTGHTTGRCSIVDWVKLVPVILYEGRYKIVVRGTPEVYSLIHKEQWFKPVEF